MFRNHTKTIRIRDRVIGGGNPILVQSICNTKTEDISTTVSQIRRPEQAGCDIIRVAVPTVEAARALPCIRKEIYIPLVAGIHFDYRLAIASIGNGADKIHINPDNIGDYEKVKAIMDKTRKHDIPIKVGVNSGSLRESLLEKYGGVTAEGVVESALGKVRLIEDMGYDNLVISIKSSGMMMCVKARELITSRTGYPLHVRITESGTLSSGNIKSSVGLGIILYQGIGDTTRVSLTEGPVEEIKSAKLILYTLGLRSGGIEVVSCPTCDRMRIDLIRLVNQVEATVSEFDDLDVKVVVMGCVINRSGEAREVGISITGGMGEGLLIRKGGIIREVPEVELLPVLHSELESI